MRGWITDPNGEGGLRLADDLPSPVAAHGEIVVDVRAYSVNRGELSLVVERPSGFRPGQDFAGVDIESGARVVGIVDWNAWAERVAVSRAHVALLPDEVSFESAATLPVAGLTALRALRAGGSILGRRVLVIGATGGVGQLAVPLAASAGAHVTALVASPDHVAHARELGADDAVTTLEACAPFDLVLDGVGGGTLIDALHHVTPGGTVAMYGVLGGKAPLDIFDFATCPGARLVGLFLSDPGPTAASDLASLVDLVATNRLRPTISLTLDWTKTPEALAAMRARKVRGKAILTHRGEPDK